MRANSRAKANPYKGSVARDQAFAKTYLKAHPGMAGYGDSENYKNYPDDDSVESPSLYRKGLRMIPTNSNPGQD